MRTLDEAVALVAAHAGLQPLERVALRDATGLTLGEDLRAERDSPPFAKAMMDGFAVRNADLPGGAATLAVQGTIFAGQVAGEPLRPGHAYAIMTGAPMPAGAEAVVPVERSVRTGAGVALDDPAFRPGQHVLAQGAEMRAGDAVLAAGTVLAPAALGLLATLGVAFPLVRTRPHIAFLATGSEIVPADAMPGPGQIRNSNGPTVEGLFRASGYAPVDLGIAGDDADELRAALRRGLGTDVLVVTGGVSAGAADLVPKLLTEIGVREVFHKVSLKPGAPVWFGTTPRGVVFGLPGNPVSVLACFEVFVQTALRARQGAPCPGPAWTFAKLTRDCHYPTKRQTLHPAALRAEAGELRVEPLPWLGSPDLRGAAAANALLDFPAGEAPCPAGALMRVLPLTGMVPACRTKLP